MYASARPRLSGPLRGPPASCASAIAVTRIMPGQPTSPCPASPVRPSLALLLPTANLECYSAIADSYSRAISLSFQGGKREA